MRVKAFYSLEFTLSSGALAQNTRVRNLEKTLQNTYFLKKMKFLLEKLIYTRKGGTGAA